MVRKQTSEKSKAPLWVFLIGLVLLFSVVGYIAYDYLELRPARLEALSEREAAQKLSQEVEVIEPEPEPIPLKTDIAFSAVGDVTFSSSSAVWQGDPFVRLAGVATKLAASDLTFGNLETPISDRGTRWPNKKYHFLAKPESADALKNSGFDVVSLANNHTLDFGYEAFDDTMKLLTEREIVGVGGGANWEEATAVRYVEKNGHKLAFIAQSQITPIEFAAKEDKAGNFYRQELDVMLERIAEAKQEADFVIVSMHWGKEYSYDANGRQINEAHQLIDAGANVVLGHHPHRIQGIEFYKDSLIAYSLANFVFTVASAGAGDTYILDFTLGESGISNVVAHPVFITGRNPQLVGTSGSNGSRITSVLSEKSKNLGSVVEVVGDELHFKAGQ